MLTCSLCSVQGLGCTAEHMDLVLFTVMHHFGRRQRWQAALSFFSSLMELHPGAAVYISAAQVGGAHGRPAHTVLFGA